MSLSPRPRHEKRKSCRVDRRRHPEYDRRVTLVDLPKLFCGLGAGGLCKSDLTGCPGRGGASGLNKDLEWKSDRDVADAYNPSNNAQPVGEREQSSGSPGTPQRAVSPVVDAAPLHSRSHSHLPVWTLFPFEFPYWVGWPEVGPTPCRYTGPYAFRNTNFSPKTRIESGHSVE